MRCVSSDAAPANRPSLRHRDSPPHCESRREHGHQIAMIPFEDRAAVIAQDLVDGKAKATVGRNALDQVAFDDAGHDRVVGQADVVQAAEIEPDERLRAGLPHLKVRIAGEGRPLAGLGRRARRELGSRDKHCRKAAREAAVLQNSCCWFELNVSIFHNLIFFSCFGFVVFVLGNPETQTVSHSFPKLCAALQRK